MKFNLSDKNNSTALLALLCLLYLFITSSYKPFSSNKDLSTSEDYIYIEITENGISRVKSFSDPKELEAIRDNYSLQRSLVSGDRITIGSDETLISKMSGRKRISLGIPIGINSAISEDLQAIPGIGPELANRIIRYRASKGRFESIYELDNIKGISERKLESIKKLCSLD